MSTVSTTRSFELESVCIRDLFSVLCAGNCIVPVPYWCAVGASVLRIRTILPSHKLKCKFSSDKDNNS